MQYNLRVGDMISTESGCGIIVKKTPKYVYYYFRGGTHRVRKENLLSYADSSKCKIYMGSSTKGRRKRKLGEDDV